MKSQSRTKKISAADIRVGSLLLAQPFRNNNHELYNRSAIILIDHDTQGSTGLLVNKICSISLLDALPELNENAPLYFGGPINQKVISYLHNNAQIPGSYYLGNNLYWGGYYDYILEMSELKTLSLKKFHFYAGFVQWANGQLEEELNDDRWWMTEVSEDQLLENPPQDLWGEKLVEGNHAYGLFQHYPDPSKS